MCLNKLRLGVIFLVTLAIFSCTQESNSKIEDSTSSIVLKGLEDKGVKALDTISARQFNFPSPNYVLVAAHRAGCFVRNVAPENSLSAIQNALSLGVDIIEIDVRITLDHELVVIHDKTLDRTTNGRGEVSYQTLNDIKKLYLKDKKGNITNERVPTLEEVMTAIGNKALVFIDKSELVIPYVIPVLNKTNSISQSLFMDFVDSNVAKNRYNDLLSKAYYVPGIHDSFSELDAIYSGFAKTLMPHPSAFAFWFKKENSKSFSLIPRAINDHVPVWINATTADQCAGHTDEASLSNPENGWGWILKQGANIIFTDQPEELIKYLAAKGLR